MATKYNVSYLPLADRDILRISEALEKYPNKAKRLFQEIEKKVKDLENMPYRHPAYNLNSKYSQMVLEDHLLFYIVDESEGKVMVHRVLYAKMDVPKHIEPEY